MLKLSDYIPALRYGAQIDVGQNTDLDASSSLSITSYMTHATNSKPIVVNAYPTLLTAGTRAGVLAINLTRTSSYPLTSWDGNPDCGIKMSIYNSAANGTNGATRGLDMTVRNTGSGATESWINGMAITAENKTGAGTIQSAITAQFNIKNDGVVATSNYGVVIQDQSQGTNPAATAMFRATTSTIAPASGAVPAVIDVAAKNTSGFTYLFDLETDLIDTATVGGTVGAAAGTILIRVAGTPYELLFYAVA
jgi:hypothetical protein